MIGGKKFEKMWAKHIASIKEEDFKVRFIEEEKKYTFIAYGKSKSNLVLYKNKLDMSTPYTKFKENLSNDTIFTFAYKKGNNLRLSENNKTIKNVQIMNKREIPPDSIERLVLESKDVAEIVHA